MELYEQLDMMRAMMPPPVSPPMSMMMRAYGGGQDPQPWYGAPISEAHDMHGTSEGWVLHRCTLSALSLSLSPSFSRLLSSQCLALEGPMPVSFLRLHDAPRNVLAIMLRCHANETGERGEGDSKRGGRPSTTAV